MTNGRVKVIGGAAAALVLGLLLALLGALPRSDRSLREPRESGRIAIGYAVEAPYAFFTEDTRLTGEAPEVARWVVGELGIPIIDWVCTEFGRLIEGLESGRFDVVAAGMFITPDRARAVLFSNPSLHVEQALLVRRGNPYRLHSYEEVVGMSAVKIAVLTGSVEEQLFLRSGVPEGRLVPVPDALTGRGAVRGGMADGLALSFPSIKWMQEKLGDKEVAMAVPFAQPRAPSMGRLGYCAFAFRKHDRRLRDAWNAAMERFVGSPEHIRLISGFSLTEANLPGSVTVKDVLSDE